jgi:hypothetical protein
MNKKKSEREIDIDNFCIPCQKAQILKGLEDIFVYVFDVLKFLSTVYTRV